MSLKMKKVKLSKSISSFANNPEAQQIQTETVDLHRSQESLKTKTSNHNQHARQMDPMKIELILERVFDFCSVQTLKTCRVVSTQWRDVSLKAWRDKAVLMCTASDDDADGYCFNFKKYLQLLESEEVDAGDDDIAEFRNLKMYPFKSFSLQVNDYLSEFSGESVGPISLTSSYLRIYDSETGEFTIGSKSEIHELGEFLSRFRSLEYLVLKLCLEQEDHSVETEGFLDFLLPTVKRLRIEVDNGNCVDVWAWKHVLKWLPNLKFLSFMHSNITESECLDSVNSILEFVRNIRESSGESVMAIEELELNSKPSEDPEYTSTCHPEKLISTIVASNFPLKSLTITLGWEGIYEVLESCKSTLQYLTTSFDFSQTSFDDFRRHENENENCKRSSICMEQLKEASLGNGHHRALYFLPHLELPKLERLTIDNVKIGVERITWNSPLLFPRGRVYESLETFEFLDDLATPSAKTLETFVRIMPNLVHLTIPLDKTTFQIVCQRFKGLKTLNILSAKLSHEELDDESITGISKETVRCAPRQRRPNVTDLALLRDLKISCDSQLLGNRVGFTDHSVVRGFLQLPRLYSLSIAFRELSKEIKAKLLNHLKGNLCIQEKPRVVDYCSIEIGDECTSYSKSDEAEGGIGESRN